MLNLLPPRSQTAHPCATDAELLRQFTTGGDHAALQALVERHAPLVWGVSRRLLADRADAEDVFQATFVVLLRQAPGLHLRGGLGSWLYGVTRRIAGRVRQRVRRRAVRTPGDLCHRPHGPVDEWLVRDLVQTVQAELDRLPKRYRVVLELCLFQDLPPSRAAERLQLSVGVVRGCFQRGRDMLRRRLALRGITPSVLATWFVASAADAAAPALASRTVAHLTGQIPARVLALATGGGMRVGLMVWLVTLLGLACTLCSINAMALPRANAFGPADSHVELTGTVPDPIPPQGLVTGYVDDENGRPVARAVIEVYRHRHANPEQTLQADGVGQFYFPAAWREEEYRHFLVRRPDALGWGSVGETKPAGNTVHVRVYSRQAILRGRVVDASQKPIAGAKLRADYFFGTDGNGGFSEHSIPADVMSSLATETDAQGRYTLRVPIRCRGFATVTAEGCLNSRLNFDSVRAGEAEAEPVVLEPGAVLAGVVLSPRGQPVEGVKLLVQRNEKSPPKNTPRFTGDYGHAYTDRAGRFRITGLDPENLFNVMIYDPYFAPNEKTPWILEAREGVACPVGKPAELELRLVPARAITGTVVSSATGKPVTNTRIAYYGPVRPRTSAACESERLDGQGRFRIWTTPGAAYLYMQNGDWVGTWDVKVPEQGLHDLNLDVQPQTERREPFGHGGISVSSTRDQRATEARPVIAYPIQYGDGLPRGENDVRYGQVVEYRVPEGLSVRQVSIRTYDGKRLLRSAGLVNEVGLVHLADDRSIVSLPYKVGHALTLEIYAEGFERVVRTFTIDDKQPPVVVDLKEARYLPVEGTVTDPQGKPVNGARVQVVLRHHADTESVPWGPETTTDARGGFAIKHLRVGDTYRLRIFGPDGLSALTDWQTVAAGAGRDHPRVRLEKR